MKNKTSFVFVFWWIMVMFFFGMALLMFADKEERISESENRMLSGFPEVSVDSILSGEFSSGFESFLSDGVFGRDSIISVSEELLRLFSRNTQEDTLLLDDLKLVDEIKGNTGDEGQADDSSGAVSGTDAQTSPEGGAAADGDEAGEGDADIPVTGEISGYGFWIKLSDNRYKQQMSVTEDQLKKVADNLNQYKQCLPEGGNVFYTNVARTHQALMLHDSVNYSGWFENIDEGISKYLDEGVYYVNSIKLMEGELLDKQPLYFTSDHHWTPRAAFLVMNECKRLQGIPAVDYDEYDYKVNIFKNKSKGTADDMELLYPLQQVKGYNMVNGNRDESSDLIYYSKSSYYAYLNGDTRGWTQYDTGFNVGKNALVIGDSFSNTFLPYLMPYYDEVNKVDIRHFSTKKMKINLSDMIKKHNIHDVFIVVSHLNGVNSEKSYSKLGTMLNG